MSVRNEKLSLYTVLASASLFALLVYGPHQAFAQSKLPDKWITLVMPQEPTGLEGCESSSRQMGLVKENLVETVLQKNPLDGSPEPLLATSWKQIDDKTWRLVLRQGVTFHDGSPFNATTLKKSIDRTMRSDLVCQDRTKFFGGIPVETVVVDDYTVDIKTPQSDPLLPIRLTGLAVVGPNEPSKPSRSVVGTGPYVFDSWDSGRQVQFKRNDKYWGEKPAVEGVRYIWRDVSSVIAAMVKIGEADLAPIIAAQDATDPELDRSYLNSETTFIGIDMEIPPLNDVRVRRALNYAMDREGMRHGILPKDSLNATQLVIPSVLGHNHEIDKKIYAYDPAKAKQLLAEAKADGVPVDKEIMLYGRPTGYPNSTEVAEAFLSYYKAIGLSIKLQNLEPGQFQEINHRPHAENRAPYLLQSTHDNNAGDPIFTVPAKFSCKSDTAMMCDPAFDAQILKVAALTGQARTDGWRELFRSLYEDVVPSVFMYHMVGYARIGKRINYKPDDTTGSAVRISTITFR